MVQQVMSSLLQKSVLIEIMYSLLSCVTSMEIKLQHSMDIVFPTSMEEYTGKWRKVTKEKSNIKYQLDCNVYYHIFKIY